VQGTFLVLSLRNTLEPLKVRVYLNLGASIGLRWLQPSCHLKPYITTWGNYAAVRHIMPTPFSEAFILVIRLY